jgi:hypothetical protein
MAAKVGDNAERGGKSKAPAKVERAQRVTSAARRLAPPSFAVKLCGPAWQRWR